MKIEMKRWLRTATVMGAVAAVGACDSFLDVDDPTVIDAETIDPVLDLPTFANSALQNLFDAFDNFVVYSGWFSGEAYVGDTFPTRNDIGRRTVEFSNGTLRDDVYFPLAQAISTNENVLKIMTDNSVSNPEIEATANFASGWAILFEAESFCEVVISRGLADEDLGTPISPEDAMGEAIARFNAAIAAAGGDANIVSAANAGKARAHLFRGEYSEAIAAAALVPAEFAYAVPKVDDPAFRNRLGNTVWGFTLARASLVVPPYFRDLNDPRIAYRLWTNDSGTPIKSQGNDFDFYGQEKYPNWDASLRFASGLEARYISAEAQLKSGNEAAALELIAERTVPEAASGDDIDFVPDTGTLVQLLDQKARDFFLEGTHLGDWRRNPDSTPYVAPAGAPYYADEVGGQFGNVACLPTPQREVDNNPNF
jgi:hypothetical protein